MIIDPNNSINARSFGAGKAGQPPVDKAASESNNAPKSAPASDDSVSLSSASRTIANLETRVRESADVNSERVAEVKQAVDSGSYSISAKEIADKISAEENALG